jgi:hypothetical protein
VRRIGFDQLAIDVEGEPFMGGILGCERKTRQQQRRAETPVGNKTHDDFTYGISSGMMRRPFCL